MTKKFLQTSLIICLFSSIVSVANAKDNLTGKVERCVDACTKTMLKCMDPCYQHSENVDACVKKCTDKVGPCIDRCHGIR